VTLDTGGGETVVTPPENVVDSGSGTPDTGHRTSSGWGGSYSIPTLHHLLFQGGILPVLGLLIN